jgi:hypothetical protein
MAAISFSGRSGCLRRCRVGRLSGSFSGARLRACRSYSGWRLRLGPLPTPASIAAIGPLLRCRTPSAGTTLGSGLLPQAAT